MELWSYGVWGLDKSLAGLNERRELDFGVAWNAVRLKASLRSAWWLVFCLSFLPLFVDSEFGGCFSGEENRQQQGRGNGC